MPSTMTKTFCLLWSMELGDPRLIIRGHTTFDHSTKKLCLYKDGIKGGFDVYMHDINISKHTYTCWHQHQTPNGCIF